MGGVGGCAAGQLLVLVLLLLGVVYRYGRGGRRGKEGGQLAAEHHSESTAE